MNAFRVVWLRLLIRLRAQWDIFKVKRRYKVIKDDIKRREQNRRNQHDATDQ